MDIIKDTDIQRDILTGYIRGHIKGYTKLSAESYTTYIQRSPHTLGNNTRNKRFRLECTKDAPWQSPAL